MRKIFFFYYAYPMQYLCILHVIMIDKRIATVQERIIAAVRVSESQLEGKNQKGFQIK